MKANNKYLFFVAGAFIALSACQQDESLTQRPQGDASVITFNSPYTVDSRSDAMRSGSFKTGDKVGVLGYCKASNQETDYSTSPWDTKKPFCTPDVFYNQMLEYNGTGAWDYSWTGTFDGEGPVGTLHPWSKNEDDTFSFFAYYPYAELAQQGDTWEGIIDDDGLITDERDKRYGLGTITLSGQEERGDPTITYTMPHHPAKLDSDLDWWVVPDFMLAYKINHKKQDGSVKLDFRHLFCAFEFVVNNYTLDDVVIEDLYIGGGKEENGITTGFYKSVTVEGQESGYSVGNDIYYGDFKLIGEENRPYILPNLTCGKGTLINEETNEIKPTNTEIKYNNSAISLLFIPDYNGKLTTDGNESLYIRLRVTKDGQTFIKDEPRSMNLENISFAPGVRSIFNINIIGNDFYIQMRSDGSWSDGGDSDIVFE